MNCNSAYMTASGNAYTKIQPFEGEENCPETGTFSRPGLRKKQAVLMMAELRKEFQVIVDSYAKYIQKTESTKSDW